MIKGQSSGVIATALASSLRDRFICSTQVARLYSRRLNARIEESTYSIDVSVVFYAAVTPHDSSSP